MNKVKGALVETLPVALWVAFSAGAMFVLTELLKRPDLAPYYGVFNVLLVLLNEFRKA